MCVINTATKNIEYTSGSVLNSVSLRQDTSSGINEVSNLWCLNSVAVMHLIFFRLTIYTGCMIKEIQQK